MKAPFSYIEAFDRNIGWLTEWEQLALRGKRIAIAGMGGVGGVHLLTLARFGIGAFHIADFDRFDIVNFNRQIGATIETIGRPKVEVLAEMALAINPELQLTRFEAGINDDNIDAFLDGVDVFVDGFDFFEIEIRSRVYARCAERGIPALCAAPIGMGAGCLAFLPGKMTFEEYFGFAGKTENERFLRFLIGLAPKGLHRAYLVEPSAIDLPGHKGPSTGASCQICAGITAVNAVKLLLRRGVVQAAPYHHHYDAYRNKLVISRLPRGLNGPWQRVKLAIARRLYEAARTRTSAPLATAPRTAIEDILNYARWAPSLGNAQPWRFTFTGANSLIVEIAPGEREPTLLAAGMLVENLRIAASARGFRMAWRDASQGGASQGGGSQGGGSREGGARLAVHFSRDDSTAPDPLFSHLTTRGVDRRPYRLRRLTAAEKSALAEALGAAFTLEWHETPAARWRLARLATGATRLMLGEPAAVAAEAARIDWDHARSPERVPAAALGLGWLGRKIGRAAPSRLPQGAVRAGLRLASFRLEALPILASAAGFVVRRAASAEDHGAVALIAAGAALQRFWLTAARLGLGMQPLMRPLALARRASASGEAGLAAFARSFRAEIGAPEEVLFIGRIGERRGRSVATRATRLGLDALIVAREDAALPERHPDALADLPVS